MHLNNPKGGLHRRVIYKKISKTLFRSVNGKLQFQEIVLKASGEFCSYISFYKVES